MKVSFCSQNCTNEGHDIFFCWISKTVLKMINAYGRFSVLRVTHGEQMYFESPTKLVRLYEKNKVYILYIISPQRITDVCVTLFQSFLIFYY